MSAVARRSLTVFFDGEERSGVIFYALMRPNARSDVGFPISLWPNAMKRPFRLGGELWEVQGWDVALQEWPQGEDWIRVLKETFRHLVDSGAIVSWLGAEGCPFSDPPNLLSPAWMSGGVLAAMTSTGEFFCAIDPDLPIATLTDEQLVALRRHARGLADTQS